jgi:hypothetical protein
MKKLIYFATLTLFILHQKVNAQAPGNVSSNLTLWINASDNYHTGTTTATNGQNIDRLIDQSGNAADFIQTDPTKKPIYNLSGFNFNASIGFDGSNDYIRTGGVLPALTNSYSGFVVLKKATTGLYKNFMAYQNSTWGQLWSYAEPAGGNNFTIYSNTPSNWAWAKQSTQSLNTQTQLLSSNWSNTGTLEYRANGKIKGSHTQTNLITDIPVNARMILGARGSNGSLTSINRHFDGQIAEVIYYHSSLSLADQNKVRSYLGVKYGLTLDHDYLASNGTVIWNATNNAGHHNNVAGIGRDDASALAQQKSLSEHPSASVTMVKTTAFANDLDFLIWGNNGASGTSTNVSTAYNIRTNKVWKTAVTGAPGTVNFSIDIATIGLPNTGNAADYTLLKDTDTDFSTGETAHNTGVNLIGNVLSFTGVSFSDGEYFTIANKQFLPGGIAGLNVWLKADAGTNALASSWKDKSGNGLDYATVAGPTVIANSLNFNPTVEILNGGFNAPNGSELTNSWSMFYIYKKISFRC